MASVGVRAVCALRTFTPTCFSRLQNGLSRNFQFAVQRNLSVSHRVFADLKYTEQHEWVRLDGAVGTVGITAKAAESMGDLVYVEIAEPGLEVDQGDECGSVESVKAVSDIYAPVSGKITDRNTDLSDTPELVNQDPYGEQGWLFKIELSKPEELDALMTEEQYTAFITEE
ncbi:Glycine cleavage system H protein, mitochondrial [Amphibalanus amphitrite]|uniref:Glycine cleavage system H protein n=2 Tax=Amphibalanus amphitrite TaxID=1232801 RepID=A0A6A4VS98_AMPAM|nr:Glycine cleavage system H protein, mitochondrial [Amphibalanus amphitrite]